MRVSGTAAHDATSTHHSPSCASMKSAHDIATRMRDAPLTGKLPRLPAAACDARNDSGMKSIRTVSALLPDQLHAYTRQRLVPYAGMRIIELPPPPTGTDDVTAAEEQQQQQHGSSSPASLNAQVPECLAAAAAGAAAAVTVTDRGQQPPREAAVAAAMMAKASENSNSSSSALTAWAPSSELLLPPLPTLLEIDAEARSSSSSAAHRHGSSCCPPRAGSPSSQQWRMPQVTQQQGQNHHLQSIQSDLFAAALQPGGSSRSVPCSPQGSGSRRAVARPAIGAASGGTSGSGPASPATRGGAV